MIADLSVVASRSKFASHTCAAFEIRLDILHIGLNLVVNQTQIIAFTNQGIITC